MNKKVLWIENFKGFTMLAVVLGHIATPLTNFIFSWHMPAFFFLSGFFINSERPIKESVKKNAKRLLLPFLIFGLIGFVIEIIKRKLFAGFEFAVPNFIIAKEIQGLFFWMDFTHMHQYGFVLWFLVALFWGKLVLQFFIKFIRSEIIIGIICLILFFTLANQSFILPFSIDKGLFSLSWLFGGYLFYKYNVKKDKLKTGTYLAVIAIIIVSFLPIPVINISTKIAQNPALCLLYSFSIIILLVAIFRNFGDKYLNNLFFENWGRNSLAILIMHPYTNNVGYIVGNKFFNGSWVANFIISVIILVILLLVIQYAKRIFKNSRFAHCFQSTRIN
ncbi:MAG: acyltransferase family protein [bacterium]|nr:acyltransferase family protein [bacterium]